MADTEYEELCPPVFNTRKITHQIYGSTALKMLNNSAPPHSFYSLTANDDLELEDTNSSKSDTSDQETDRQRQNIEDDELGDGLKVVSLSSEGSLDTQNSFDSHRNHPLNHQNAIGGLVGNASTASAQEQTAAATSGQQRRRRKLPEIPKNTKSPILHLLGANAAGFLPPQPPPPITCELSSNAFNNALGGITKRQRSILSLKCGYLLDEDSSPDSERLQSLGDVDSGHSTAHSPTDFKSISPQLASPMTQSQFSQTFGSGVAAICGGVPFAQLELLEATHRGLHKFVPRHHDEIEIEIGDGVYVQKEADDLWCEGVNLRTGRQGIFPSAYAVDLEYNEFDPTVKRVKKERYLLEYLGSVETLAHKGIGVVCQAVRKIVSQYGDSPSGQVCILEISDQGLRMVERSAPNANKKDKKLCIDYFYSLKNVSFCAFHPRNHRFIGFITKHPTVQRFACHVFVGSESTRPVAEAVGRAFQRFYQKFVETAYPIEDIYIE